MIVLAITFFAETLRDGELHHRLAYIYIYQRHRSPK